MTAQEIFEKDMEGGYKWFAWNEETSSEEEDDQKDDFSTKTQIGNPTKVETPNQYYKTKMHQRTLKNVHASKTSVKMD